MSGSAAAGHESRTAPPVRESVATARPGKLGATESTGVVGTTVRETVFPSSVPHESLARTANRYTSPFVRPETTRTVEDVEYATVEKLNGAAPMAS